MSIDWTREVVTCRPEYYKWTQWLFLQFYKKGLAYKKEAPVNWCPSCQTVLANEQVIDGRCERCDTEVEAKKLTQWFFRITDYAERLLQDFDKLESWPERVITMQRNWIGKSEGANVVFRLAPRGAEKAEADAGRRPGGPRRSPSSPPGPTRCSGRRSSSWRRSIRWWTSWCAGTAQEAEVKRYVAKAMATSAIERGERREGEDRRLHRPLRRQPGHRRAASPSTWPTTCSWTTAPAPSWPCPAHDERDFDFAKKYGLPVIEVIDSPAEFKDADGAMLARPTRATACW